MIVRIIDHHATTEQDFDRLAETIDAQMAGVPLYGVLQIALQGSPTPGLSVLRRAAQVMEARADRAVLVIATLGLGFWASTFRSAVRAFGGLLRTSSFQLESSIEGAAEVLARELVGLNADELLAGFVELLEYMRSLPPEG